MVEIELQLMSWKRDLLQLLEGKLQHIFWKRDQEKLLNADEEEKEQKRKLRGDPGSIKPRFERIAPPYK